MSAAEQKQSSLIKAGAGAVRQAAQIIQDGGLVAFPTETVYGLGANALNGQAVARIFAAKERPDFNPLIVHFHDQDQLPEYVEFNETARLLASHFWPGPISFVLPQVQGCKISELCSAGLPTLAVRVPAHKIAQSFLKECGVPVAAPSANKSGRLSPTAPVHVVGSLGNAVDMVLAAGNCEVGLESTVLDLSGSEPVLLRFGAITAEQISSILGYDIKVSGTHIEGETVKSPGQLLQHYAPSISVRMNAVDLNPGEALLAFGSDKFMGIKGGGAAKDLPDCSRSNLSETSDLNEAAANLFRMLHNLDRAEHSAIAVMPIPRMGIGVAINDRLSRAAQSGKS